MQPRHNKIHLFSTITPIQPGVLTIVDLGDTSGAFSPLILAEQPGKDSLNLPIPPAKDSEDTNVVDLRSLGFKKGKLVSVFEECRL